MDKSPDAFRTISEVAAELDLPQHVLRFWETRFTQIKPLKRGGGRRYYRPDDVDLLAGIRKLLYGEGYTIKGVQRLLKENGIHWVMDVGRGIESGAPGASHQDDDDLVDEGAPEESKAPPQAVLPMAAQTAVRVPERASQPPQGELPAQAPRAPTIVPADEPLPRDVLADDVRTEPHRSSFSLMERLRGEPRAEDDAGLGKEDVRRLQATLFELLECKRILDQAR